jgi:hypothetical protein
VGRRAASAAGAPGDGKQRAAAAVAEEP